MRKDYLVIDKLGLHARPASMIASAASKFTNEISILYKDKKANAKSVMSVMSLAISANSTFTLVVEGEECTEVFNGIEAILNENNII